MDLRGPLRLFRAVLVTAAAVSLAAAGHVLGGGALPAPAIMAVLAALLLAPVEAGNGTGRQPQPRRRGNLLLPLPRQHAPARPNGHVRSDHR
jgi:hypothetical protein